MGNRVVSQAIPKVDYKALVTGKAVYTDDLAAKDSLVVKVLRSPSCTCIDSGYQSDKGRTGSGY